jgi:acyl carrier protein
MKMVIDSNRERILKMRDPLGETVRCAVAQHLEVDSIDIRSSHRFERDLGLERIDIVLVVLRVEEVENVELPFDRLDQIDSVADLTALLRAVIANDNQIPDPES